MDSSKIKKVITSIRFDGDRTIIGFGQNFQPAKASNPVNEGHELISDLPRHPDFNRAMDRFKAHLILRTFSFVEFKDKLGKDLDKEWFDEHLYEDDNRFSEVEVLSVVVTTKKDVTGFYLNGTTLSVDDQVVKLKSPVISTIKLEGGYNYPLLDIITAQWETLLEEAQEFIKYKNGDPQLKLAV